MHRSHPSNGGTGDTGGIFKGGSVFGGNKTPTPARPSTSGGSPPLRYSSTTSRTSGFTHKTSFSSTTKSPKSSHRGRNNSTAIPNLSPEKRIYVPSAYTDTHPLPLVIPAGQFPEAQKFADSFRQVADNAEAVQSPASGTDSFTSTTPYSNMLVRPGIAYQAMGSSGPPSFAPMQPPSPTLETITYQHIQETSSKRISTLDYLRKA
jgi:hypothetical protein